MKQQEDIKEFLRSVRYNREEIERLTNTIKEMETQATKVTSTITGMPRSGSADSQALWARIADETAELYDRLRTHCDKVKAVEDFIDRIPTEKHRAVLKLRYISCYNWNDIARCLERAGYFYEIRQVYRIHGAALEEARALWNKEEK